MKRSLTALLLLLCFAACHSARRPPAQPADIVVQDVGVIDVVTGRLLAHRDVAIAGGKIVALVEHDPDASPPRAARLVSGAGRFLIPGLWDMHVHALWATEALNTFLPLFVSQGVTGVRDMGGTLEFLHAARDSIAQGAWYPSLVASGPMVDGPEPVDPAISIAVGDTGVARRAVDSLARAGVDFIKVYTLLPRAEFVAVLNAAARWNLPVSGHVPGEVTPEEAARLGQRSIEHLRDELEPYCTRATPETCRGALAEFKRNGVWQVPTLHVLRMKAILNDTSLLGDPRLEYMPAAIRRDWVATQASRARRPPSYFIMRRERILDEIWLAGLIFRDQGHVLAGTDAGVHFSYPGFSLHDELALLVQAGLSPLEALRAATIEPARFLGQEDSVGSIAVGDRADLVLLRENPLNDIGATRSIESVILRGRLLDPAALDQLMAGVKQRANE
jgi:imidazolonepropionase-like amidohydrolase